MEGGGSTAVRRTAGISSPGGGGVFGREKLLGILAVRSCVSCWGCIYVGCSQRTPEPGWLKNNRSLSLSILEAEKVQVRVLAHSASGEGLIPVSSCAGKVREPMTKSPLDGPAS